MHALILKEYGRLVVEEFPEPAVAPGEVLVRVRACGICGSDVHGMDGSTSRRIPPIIMGHEAAGEIAEIGAGVADWKPGERVTFDSTIYCGACWHCKRREVNLCERRTVLGVSCKEYRRQGAFAEYVSVPERILHPLPDSISFQQGALAEPVSVAVHAVRRTPLSSNAPVAVVGAGMIGLLTIQALRVAGCHPIIAIDLDQARLQLAGRLGATHLLTGGQPDLLEKIRALTDGRGVDAAFEAVGLGTTVELAVNCVRKGGSVTLIGNLAPRVELPLQTIVTRELRLIGSCASAGEYPDCLALIASGKINVTEFISGTAPLAEGPRWFARLRAGEKGLMKVLLTP